MNITMIGTGYVGLVTGAMFADRGNKVTCVDTNQEIVDTLREGEIHIYEPGLEEIVKRAVSNRNLSFTTSLSEPMRNAEAVFIAVGTPSNNDGSFNLSAFYESVRSVGNELRDAPGFKVIVGKSTVPQRTNEEVTRILTEQLGAQSEEKWAYVVNPETLAEGTAVSNFAKPDRVIVGTYSDKAYDLMRTLYHPFIRREERMEKLTPASAELTKLGSNAALAQRVAFIDEMACICDVTPGADMEEVRRYIGADPRIGAQFLFAGPGYGGSCFPKDIQGLVAQAQEDGFDPVLIGSTHTSNEHHKTYMGFRVVKLSINNPNIAIWGATFKPETDDMRDSSFGPIVTQFINNGANVTVYEPKDEKARAEFGDKVRFVNDPYTAVESADALVLLTDWSEFHSPDFKRLSETMHGNTIFDLRNRWIPEEVNQQGLHYYGVGRNFPLPKKEVGQ